MECVCVTGVEDRLQAHVRTTLEKLKNANVRTWMLTGDKLETAVSPCTQCMHPPPSIYRYERLQELGPFREHTFSIDGRGWDEAAVDVVLPGLGWVSITGMYRVHAHDCLIACS